MKHVCWVFSSSSSWNPLIRIVHRISFEWYATEDNKKNARQTLVIEKTSALDMQQCLQAMCIIRVLWRIGLLFSHVYNSWMDVAYTLIQFDSSRICNFFCDLRALRAAYWTIYECVCSLSSAKCSFSLSFSLSRCVFSFLVFIVPLLTRVVFLFCGNWNFFDSRRDWMDSIRLRKNRFQQRCAFIPIKCIKSIEILIDKMRFQFSSRFHVFFFLHLFSVERINRM